MEADSCRRFCANPVIKKIGSREVAQSWFGDPLKGGRFQVSAGGYHFSELAARIGQSPLMQHISAADGAESCFLPNWLCPSRINSSVTSSSQFGRTNALHSQTGSCGQQFWWVSGKCPRYMPKLVMKLRCPLKKAKWKVTRCRQRQWSHPNLRCVE